MTALDLPALQNWRQNFPFNVFFRQPTIAPQGTPLTLRTLQVVCLSGSQPHVLLEQVAAHNLGVGTLVRASLMAVRIEGQTGQIFYCDTGNSFAITARLAVNQPNSPRVPQNVLTTGPAPAGGGYFNITNLLLMVLAPAVTVVFDEQTIFNQVS